MERFADPQKKLLGTRIKLERIIHAYFDNQTFFVKTQRKAILIPKKNTTARKFP